ncbi:MAG: hypothetical protein AABX13_06610 [Nanoarchaeota archaeon]
MAKKKEQTVEDIINGYQKFHHKTGKSFKERIKKFEEFHDPDNIHAQQFAHHAHYVLFGKPTDAKTYPGAYNEAYKVLDKHVEGDNDKLEDEDKLAEVLERYTDTFLQNALGGKYKEIVAHAEKEGKLSKKDLRELKGQLLGQFAADDEGKYINPLSDQFIKDLKGKKKVEIINVLQEIADKMKDNYTARLHNKALEGLISEDDRLEMAQYIGPIFTARGWKHKKEHIFRSAHEQAGHYGALLQGQGKTLQERGYKPVKYEKKDEK